MASYLNIDLRMELASGVDVIIADDVGGFMKLAIVARGAEASDWIAVSKLETTILSRAVNQLLGAKSIFQNS